MAKKRKKNRSTRLFLIVMGAIVLLSVVFLVTSPDSAVQVLVEDTASRTIISSVSESGTVEPKVEVKIAPDVSGEIVELNVKEGDQVKKGDLLVVIRPDNYRALLDQAQAAVNSANANYNQAKSSVAQARATYLQDSASQRRTDQLYQQKAVSQVEWESAKLKLDISSSQLEAAKQSVNAAYYQLESSKASLKQARQNLDRTSITATMDGIITRLNTELGERVVGTTQMQGTEILRIADLSRMQVRVDINENDIIHLRKGDSAHIEIDAYQDRTFKGTVTEIAYSAVSDPLAAATSDQITLFEVKVEIDPVSYKNDKEMMRGLPENQSPFRPGMSAQVEIFTDRVEGVVSVPTQCVTIQRSDNDSDDEPQEIVYVLGEGNKVIVKEVEIGLSDDKYIEIKSGLAAGETIITGPPSVLYKVLKEGLIVQVMDESTKKMMDSMDKLKQE